MQLLDKPPCDPFCMGERPIVVIEMLNRRKIRIELYPEAAPITVAYFLSLVRDGFYSGLKFHRVIPNFMIQGGDPLGTGDGETEFYLKGEFAENGIENPVKHTRGTLSMARQDGCDTASCQFFIMLRNIPSMDGHYAAFGRVIEGIEAVDQIASMPTDPNDAPYAPIVMRKVCLEQDL